MTFPCRQEGWRLEHEDPHDQSSPIMFKGVVYNEMKGCFVSYYSYIPHNISDVYLLDVCIHNRKPPL